jgi:hypothetical protein
MPSHALTLLATAAGDSLLSIKLDFRLDAPLPPNVLNSFKKLTYIDMGLPCEFSSDYTGLRHDTLATLQELHLTGTSPFLDILSVLRSDDSDLSMAMSNLSYLLQPPSIEASRICVFGSSADRRVYGSVWVTNRRTTF